MGSSISPTQTQNSGGFPYQYPASESDDSSETDLTVPAVPDTTNVDWVALLEECNWNLGPHDDSLQ